MDVKVYLVHNRFRDHAGNWHGFPEERLVSTDQDDRLVAVIVAPSGSRVSRRSRRHDSDRLLVPSSPRTFWGRWFGPKRAILVKYLVQEAEVGAYHLRLKEFHPSVSTARVSPEALA